MTRRLLWSCWLGLVFSCGKTNATPAGEGAAGNATTGGVLAGGRRADAGNAGNQGGTNWTGGSAVGGADGGSRTDAGSAGEQGGADSNGGAAGAPQDTEPRPGRGAPLRPEDDVTESIECLKPAPIDGWQFPIAPQPRAVLALDPNSSSTFYGQLTSALPSSSSAAFRAWLLRTDDGGKTWCQLDLPETIHQLVVSPADRRVLYAAGATRYYRSADHGNTWHARSAVGGGRLVAHETRADTLYELGEGTRRSVDGGLSWESADGGKATEEVAFADDGREILYGLSEPCTLDRSSDWGLSWRTFRIADSCPHDPQQGRSRTLLIGSGVIYLVERTPTQTFIHHSLDNGEHWHRTNALPFDGGEAQLFRGDEPGVLYLKTPASLQRSTDYGQTWSEHLTVPDGGFVTLLGPRPGVFHGHVSTDRALLTTDDGASWTTTIVTREGTLHTVATDPQRIYIAGANRLYRSVDAGQSFVSLPWPEDSEPSRQLVVSASYPNLLLMSDGTRSWRSESGGQNWSLWPIQLTDGGGSVATFQTLAIHPRRPSEWYATVRGAPHILVSYSNGGSFSVLSTSPAARTVALAPTLAGGTVYAISGDDAATVLSRIDNSSTSWTTVCGPPSVCPSSLQVHPVAPLVLVGVGKDNAAVPPRSLLLGSQDGGLTLTKELIADAAEMKTFWGYNQNALAWPSLDHAYLSEDLGVTWSKFSVPVAGEIAPAYPASNGYFVNNGGIWRFEP
ncbi:MAG TPA: hypothetical protein VG937_24280 [Polyangiaceae bacterium]|nr:hypothetical protein [Polyangiaceae bacterium]